MSRQVAQLFEDKRQKLNLTWEAGRDGGNWLDDDALPIPPRG